MESYKYKPKLNDLPKLLSNNSTWYKTFSLDKAKNNSMGNLYTPALSNISNHKNNNYRKINMKNIIKNNSNMNISNISKISKISKISQKMTNNKFRQKKRPSSVISSRISEEETDDSIFALSQIKNIDDLISKRINKNFVWKEKPKKIYDVIASKNYKDIRKIKQRIHQTRFEPSKNFDLRTEIDKKKYFPIEKVDIINDATEIMNKIEKEMNEKKIHNFFIKRRVDMQTFAKQNRDICLKNNIINLIKEESNKLKIKEQEISKALDDANKGFNKDKRLFDSFIIKNREEIRQSELMVEKAQKYKKQLINEILKLNSDIRSNQDEIERNIRDIIIYHSYAEFIHRIIGNGQPLKKINIDKINIHKNRDEKKSLKYFVNNVFEQFDFLLNDNHISTKTYDLNFDVEQMTYLFNSLENAIMKYINERDNIIKETERERNYTELNFLHNRIVEHEKELNYLNNEMNKNKELNQSINDDIKNDFIQGQNYILEIYEELVKIFGDGGVRNNNNMETISRETFNLLHNLEDKLLFYINEMENISKNEKEPNDLFKHALEKVKNENKNIKVQKSRMALQKLEEEKLLKFQQRMNRIKIRTISEFPPPFTHKKKKENKKPKNDEKSQDDELLYY